ncbi:MAG: aldehyde dehydrogenase family protein [Saprospiraceae bacterium]
MTNSTAFSHTKADINRVFDLQVQHKWAVAELGYSERKRKLKELLRLFLSYQEAFRESMMQDFGKSPQETDLTEMLPVSSELRFVIKHLKGWMKPQPVRTPITLIGTYSRIDYEPKGVVLIISPWNFPVTLSIGPMIAAVAAGNCVMLKPSEKTQHTSAVMKRMLGEIFSEQEVAVFEGGEEVASELLNLPFDHIFFTGSTKVGKIVATKAAENLTSCTLELGGKSPTIIDEGANISSTARSIVWGKMLNAGQICISPDYVFVHKRMHDAFVEACKKEITTFYGENPELSKDYSRIVDQGQFDRLNGMLKDAVEHGATFAAGGKVNAETRYIAPTLLLNNDLESKIMQEEIFGPLLPILPFESIDEVLKFVQARPIPLTLYIFSKSSKVINKIRRLSRSGTVGINSTLIHFFNPYLPFGGSGLSGIGKAHGFRSFELFSNAKGSIRTWSPFIILGLLFPPFSGLKKKVIHLITKWF